MHLGLSISYIGAVWLFRWVVLEFLLHHMGQLWPLEVSCGAAGQPKNLLEDQRNRRLKGRISEAGTQHKVEKITYFWGRRASYLGWEIMGGQYRKLPQ